MLQLYLFKSDILTLPEESVLSHSSWQCDMSKECLQLADMGTSTDSRAGLPAAVEDHRYLGAEQLTLCQICQTCHL